VITRSDEVEPPAVALTPPPVDNGPSPEDTAVLDAEKTMRFPTNTISRPAPRQKNDNEEATAVIELAPAKKDGEKSDES
jgi:hypothetical protein